ncbi:unnamed protein product [Merluccius merluccius]
MVNWSRTALLWRSPVLQGKRENRLPFSAALPKARPAAASLRSPRLREECFQFQEDITLAPPPQTSKRKEFTWDPRTVAGAAGGDAPHILPSRRLIARSIGS